MQRSFRSRSVHVSAGSAGAAGHEARVFVLLGLGDQRRKPNVGRVDDNGGPVGGLGALVQPEVVVVAGRAVLTDVQVLGNLGPPRRTREQLRVTIDGFPLDVRHLLRGQQLAPGEFRRTLQRRDGLVGVGALQVGMAPRGARRRLLA